MSMLTVLTKAVARCLCLNLTKGVQKRTPAWASARSIPVTRHFQKAELHQ
jgi:hypothetical protein